MKKEEFKSSSKSLDKFNKSDERSSSKNPRLPKNINEYRQIIDTFLSRDTDVEWIFDLRGYSKKNNYISLKNLTMNQPSFYHDDYEKYRKKVEKSLKERNDNPIRVKGEISSIEHLINRRLDLPANPTQVGFDGTLRQFKAFETVNGPSADWKSLNLNSKRTLLDTHLPPMTKNGLKNLANLGKLVSRPYEAVKDVIQNIILLLTYIFYI